MGKHGFWQAAVSLDGTHAQWRTFVSLTPVFILIPILVSSHTAASVEAHAEPWSVLPHAEGKSIHPRAQLGSCSSSRRGRLCLPHALVGGSLFGFSHAAS